MIKPLIHGFFDTDLHKVSCPGGTPYVMGDTYVPRFWPPFFTLAGSNTIFLGYFSHPPTAKLSFGVQKLPIFTKIDLFGPKFNFFVDLFGSNFQRPVAHPHQFSGRVPPPGLVDTLQLTRPQDEAVWRSNNPCKWVLLSLENMGTRWWTLILQVHASKIMFWDTATHIRTLRIVVLIDRVHC